MERLPPNQRWVEELPVLHIDTVPPFDGVNWDLTVTGLVERPLKLTYQELLALAKVGSTMDFHCVTGVSVQDRLWEGVPFGTIVEMAGPKGRYATFQTATFYSTSLALEELEGALLAYRLDGGELPQRHGGPLRLIVPRKYAYKSVKWLSGSTFTKEKEPGYWESRGYSDVADPWG